MVTEPSVPILPGDLLQVAHRARRDLDDEAVVARDVVRLQDLGRRRDQVVERLVVAVRIAQPHERQDRQAQALRVDDRRVPLDDARLLQPAHPFGDRARGHGDGTGQLGETGPALALEDIEDAPVGGVRGIRGHVCRDSREIPGRSRVMPWIAHFRDERHRT